MATKDWKKRKKWNDWRNDKRGLTITTGTRSNPNAPIVWIDSDTSGLKTKQFKTKSQALAYAKAYMRKN